MNTFWAFIYGLIQGISEFLPISSSAHLALLPYFFELKDPGVIFDLLMHLGTAMAVLLYFRKEVLVLITEFMALLLKRNTKDTVFVQNFLIATLFSFLLILALKKLALTYGRSSLFIGINFIIFGVLMYLSDRLKSKGPNLIENKGHWQAVLIGLAQSLAIFPGVSRSGVTLTAARALGMNRYDAGKFSFLLSIPIILGSIVFKLPDIISGEATYVAPMTIFVGIFSSFIFGLLTIHFFLKLIDKLGLAYFSCYRFVLGAILIYLSLR